MLPENVFEVFYFLVARLVGFAVIQECSGIGHGTCIHLQQNISILIILWSVHRQIPISKQAFSRHPTDDPSPVLESYHTFIGMFPLHTNLISSHILPIKKQLKGVIHHAVSVHTIWCVLKWLQIFTCTETQPCSLSCSWIMSTSWLEQSLVSSTVRAFISSMATSTGLSSTCFSPTTSMRFFTYGKVLAAGDKRAAWDMLANIPN